VSDGIGAPEVTEPDGRGGPDTVTVFRDPVLRVVVRRERLAEIPEAEIPCDIRAVVMLWIMAAVVLP